jgi:hypothetical protein
MGEATKKAAGATALADMGERRRRREDQERYEDGFT